MELEDIPLAHKKSISAGRTIIALGNVKESFKNFPYLNIARDEKEHHARNLT